MFHSSLSVQRPEQQPRGRFFASSSKKNGATAGVRHNAPHGFISIMTTTMLVFLSYPDHHSVVAFATQQPGGGTWGVGRAGRTHSSSSTTFRRSATSSSSSTTASSSLTLISDSNLNLLSERGRMVVLMLAADEHQAHVVGNWPAAGTEDEPKRQLAEQVRDVSQSGAYCFLLLFADCEYVPLIRFSLIVTLYYHMTNKNKLADLDAAYPGGLTNYLSKARTLLAESAAGTNPFADYTAQIPDGETVSFNSDTSFDELEEAGLVVAQGAVFCLVAGGLGERLGFSGIKLSLSTNTCNDMCYLQFYAQYINALQERVRERTGDSSITLPLVIMTSGDTDAPTRALLQQHDNFGLAELHIVTQDKVPALKDGMAGLAMDDAWTVQTKPHGHGDGAFFCPPFVPECMMYVSCILLSHAVFCVVFFRLVVVVWFHHAQSIVHHLLYKSGLVEQWVTQGKKSHVVFLQDTNALVVNSILPTLGVSAKNGFAMNSICIPRIAGEAAGAITRLEYVSITGDSNVSHTTHTTHLLLIVFVFWQAQDGPRQELGY
jgi:UTP--glucose-1-phosphate uridylyltransferase